MWAFVESYKGYTITERVVDLAHKEITVTYPNETEPSVTVKSVEKAREFVDEMTEE